MDIITSQFIDVLWTCCPLNPGFVFHCAAFSGNVGEMESQHETMNITISNTWLIRSLPKIPSYHNESWPIPPKEPIMLILKNIFFTKRLTCNGNVLFIPRCVQPIIFIRSWLYQPQGVACWSFTIRQEPSLTSRPAWQQYDLSIVPAWSVWLEFDVYMITTWSYD